MNQTRVEAAMLSRDRVPLLCVCLQALMAASHCFSEVEPGPPSPPTSHSGDRFRVEGRAVVPGLKTHDWVSAARVLVDGEEYVGFLK